MGKCCLGIELSDRTVAGKPKVKSGYHASSVAIFHQKSNVKFLHNYLFCV